jgi:hypothetical protein
MARKKEKGDFGYFWRLPKVTEGNPAESVTPAEHFKNILSTIITNIKQESFMI